MDHRLQVQDSADVLRQRISSLQISGFIICHPHLFLFVLISDHLQRQVERRFGGVYHDGTTALRITKKQKLERADSQTSLSQFCLLVDADIDGGSMFLQEGLQFIDRLFDGVVAAAMDNALCAHMKKRLVYSLTMG